MINYGPFVYAAPPRCGSMWLGEALRQAGYPTPPGSPNWPPPDASTEFVLSVVRNPYDWLVSYYFMGGVQALFTGVTEVDVFALMKVRSQNLEGFLQACAAATRAGCVSRAFDRYQANSIIRLEDFPWAVLDFIAPFGFIGNQAPSQIAKLKPLNCRLGAPHRADPELFAMVMRSERDFCERYNYI